MARKSKQKKRILPDRIEILCDDPKTKLKIEKTLAKQLEVLVKEKEQ